MQSCSHSAWLVGLLEQGSACIFGTGATAGSELLISEPKTRARRIDPSEIYTAHPVNSSRDQQPETGSSPHLNQSIHAKSTVRAYSRMLRRL
jgi:hypothetical protein